MKSVFNRFSQGNAWRRGISALVAMVLLAVLVGSMAAVFALARHGKSAANQSKRQSTPAISATALPPDPAPTPGIYIISAKTFYSDQVSKLDPQTRQPIWTQPVDAMGAALGGGEDPYIYIDPWTTAIVVYGNTLYVASGDSTTSLYNNYIYAIDATTGAIQWKVKVNSGSAIVSTPWGGGNGYDLGALSTPTIAHGMLYVAGRDGKLYALDAATGAPLWTYDAHTTTLVHGTLSDANQMIVDQGVVYGAVHNVLYALDARTGKPVWTKQIADTQLFNAPQIVDGVLYLSSRAESQNTWPEPLNSFIYAYASKDGRPLWQHAVDSWVLAAPTVVNGVVYFGCYDYNLYALKASDGAQLWRYNTGGEIFEQPLVADGIVYIDEQGTLTPGSNSPPSNDSTRMFAIHGSSGRLVWQKTIENLTSLEQVVDGTIYVGVWPGQLYALSVKDGSVLWHQHYGSTLIDKTGTESEMPPVVTVIG